MPRQHLLGISRVCVPQLRRHAESIRCQALSQPSEGASADLGVILSRLKKVLATAWWLWSWPAGTDE